MMNERILREYERAPKRWAWNFLAAIICVMLIAWSGTTIELSNVTHNGLKIAGNILGGILHPDTELLFNRCV